MKARIALSILAVLMGLVLAGFVFRANAMEEQQRQHVLALQAEARPYEVELEGIKSELRTAENRFFTTHETACLALGVRVVEGEDIAWVEDMLRNRDVTPVLVVDCESEKLAEILDAASEKNWEIMLTTTPMNERSNALITAAVEQLNAREMRRSDVFLLRNDDISDAAVAMLASDGFLGFTRYQDAAGSGITETGMAWFSYIFYRSAQTNLAAWLSSLIGNSGAMIITLDMEAIHSGALNEESVRLFLDAVEQYASEGNLKFTSTAEIVEEIVLANAGKEERQAMYDAYLEERQARIDELNATIDGIYARWHEADTDKWLENSLDQAQSDLEQSWNMGTGAIVSRIQRLRDRGAAVIGRIYHEAESWIHHTFHG